MANSPVQGELTVFTYIHYCDSDENRENAMKMGNAKEITHVT